MEGKVLNLLSLGRQNTSTWSFTRKKLLKERLIGYSFISQMTIGPKWEIFYTVNNSSLPWLQYMFKFSKIIIFFCSLLGVCHPGGESCA